MPETKCPYCGGQKVMFRAISPQVDDVVEAGVRCIECQAKFIAVLGFVEYTDESKTPISHRLEPKMDRRDI